MSDDVFKAPDERDVIGEVKVENGVVSDVRLRDTRTPEFVKMKFSVTDPSEKEDEDKNDE